MTTKKPPKSLIKLSNDRGPQIPLRITDTTLRDAHQSLWATRMRTADILGIIDTIDAVGYYSLEVWGGATFDVCLRFLREDPWERLDLIKARCKKTPLQMLLRGQNLLGYKNYPDDVLNRFVALAVKHGVDIFRIFDALNDTRNLEQAIKAVKKYGAHAQGTICYTISPVHTVAKFVKIVKEQIEMGIDSLCIKDMAGILTPIAAEQLVSAIIRETSIPVQVHTHTTSGMATASCVEAVRAGAGAIDCAVSPMAGFSSQPPVETMLAIFEDMPYHANLDKDAIKKVCEYFVELAPRRQLASAQTQNIIDPEVIQHHIPGGMISNLRSQLVQQNALDKISEVFEELPRVRADLGYPPLVTPTSQIIGIQAVMNVLAGERYKLVPQEIKDYVRGLYGRSPAPINAVIRKHILGDEKSITCRPADLLPLGLPDATANVDPKLIQKEEDILSYVLFPEVALSYFAWRALPTDQRPPVPADEELKKQKRMILEDLQPPMPPQPFLSPTDYQSLQGLMNTVQQLSISELTIRRHDVAMTLRTDQPMTLAHNLAVLPAIAHGRAAVAAGSKGANATPIAAPLTTPAPAAPESDLPGNAVLVKSPLAGTFYRSSAPGKPPLVEVGDTVKAGDPLCIVEAMKLFNEIKATVAGKVVKIICEHGKPVAKDSPMVAIVPPV
ncbi:MAG: pyruvate carboxylase subunit B [bacterium]